MKLLERIAQPTPAEIRSARAHAGLTQAEAAELISPAQTTPYRSWQSYEVEQGKPGYRVMPRASWELFLLLTEQHPTHKLVSRDLTAAGTQLV
jgi:DNA-binding XRE family transcriptional regulator